MNTAVGPAGAPPSHGRGTGRRGSAGERGASLVEYGAVVALVALIMGGLATTTDIPGRVVRFCERAICQVAGGEDCPDEVQQAAHPDPPPIPPSLRPEEDPGAPPRPPVQPPMCQPSYVDPADEPDWVEGLHAHNDYENGTPLTDALDNGAISVEADVYLDDGELEVKHDPGDESAGTLRELYIDPLDERAQENGGEIYPGRGEPFRLVVEIKADRDGDPEELRAAYEAAFEQVRELPPDVDVLFSGGDPPEDILGEQPANSGFDIEPGPDCTLPDRVNVDSPGYDRDYARHFTVFNGEWGRGNCGDSNGGNEVDDGEQERLNELVDQAHRSGLQVRFWGGPDGRPRNPGDPGEFYACDTGILPGRQGCENEARQDAWEAQMEAGVDFYNTNHLSQSAEWLRSCGGEF